MRPGSATPTYLTERLRLRTWRPEDREPFAALNADPRVMAHFLSTLDRAASDAFADRVAAALERDGFGLWAVERREQRGLIGFVGLARPTFEAPFTPCVEVGWRLASAHWGRGYATEAAREALRVGFEELGLPSTVSFTAPANRASRRVMEKLGLTHRPEEDFEHPRLPEGHPLRPHVLYRIDRAEWLASRRWRLAAAERAARLLTRPGRRGRRRRSRRRRGETGGPARSEMVTRGASQLV